MPSSQDSKGKSKRAAKRAAAPKAKAEAKTKAAARQAKTAAPRTTKTAPVRTKSAVNKTAVASRRAEKSPAKNGAHPTITVKISPAPLAKTAPTTGERNSTGLLAKVVERNAKARPGTLIIVRPRHASEANGARHMNGNGSRPARQKGDAKRSEIVLPPDYRPLDTEPFMNERHRIYFRNKLLAWKNEILRLNMETLKGLHEESAQQADPADRATAETDRALELRARDRQRKLMNKIDAALARIEDGSYGYCEETGEPISLKRLDARPIATLSIEAQEKRERRERIFRDD